MDHILPRGFDAAHKEWGRSNKTLLIKIYTYLHPVSQLNIAEVRVNKIINPSIQLNKI